MKYPRIIQGGMGIAISSWKLAQEVSQAGGLGVVSGTSIDSVITRRLQDGDIDASVRRALSHFPDQGCVAEVLARYFIPGGRESNQSYAPVPKLSLHPSDFSAQLLVLSTFVEVWLAKENHGGLIGINFLEKIQLATPASIYGALLAKVDYILMGAGIPSEIPRVIRDLVAHEKTDIPIAVENASQKYRLRFAPDIINGASSLQLQRPIFLAIISSHILAAYLNKDEVTRPDGFVIEGPSAGGHNAPPRGKNPIGEDGQSLFSEKDSADLEKVRAIGLPFWLAGGYATPAKVQAALGAGAQGVQVGSIFALSNESGLTQELRTKVLAKIADATLEIITDPLGSPTSFPFKYVALAGTISDHEIFEERRRLCDLGYLRTVVEKSDGRLAYRCAGEPAKTFLFKEGQPGGTLEKKCLCNALMANVGMAQHRIDGYVEPPLITLGSDQSGEKELLQRYPHGWSARQVMDYLVRPSMKVSEF
jgi:NAD(P)H-dependent flavin oxidoreductase YrpB (nitropropane dioxygenase family)